VDYTAEVMVGAGRRDLTEENKGHAQEEESHAPSVGLQNSLICEIKLIQIDRVTLLLRVAVDLVVDGYPIPTG